METKATKIDPKDNQTNKFEEVYSFDYFHQKSSLKFTPSLLGKKGVREIKVPKELYKLILLEYFDIYFKEIYFINQSSYFLFTGILEKVLYRPRKIKAPAFKMKPASIGFFWSQRPSNLFFLIVRLIKLTGSTNRIPKIEKLFKNNFDMDLIVNFEEILKKNLNNKQLYL